MRWLGALLLLALPVGGPAQTVTIGSKNFTENVILGELLRQLLVDAGMEARHQAALGGTRLVFNALAAGEIDAYVEYSGTLAREIFAAEAPASDTALSELLAARGIVLAGPLGFENNYALGMREPRAAELDIRKISDLRRHPDLVFRFGNEFMERADGWPGLRAAYGLPQTDVQGIDHDLAYRALAAGDADLTDLYTTDAEIEYYGLRSLVDDRQYFPRYAAVLLYRRDLAARQPAAVTALQSILGRLDETTVRRMNAAVKIAGRSEAEVAADFLHGPGRTGLAVPGLWQRVAQRSAEHLLLVAVSLTAAVLIALPLGIVAARRPRLGQFVLGLTGIAQTVPALALLVVMVPLFGIGAGPALVALFLYALLPIVRNTHAGLSGIDPAVRESALALGLPDAYRLRRIELPLALPTILAGIKTAAVINVGGATLGALVGAGGYGQPILAGIRLDDTGLILEGALPAAGLALAVQWAFDAAERRCLPPGLRRRSGARSPGRGTS
ncbi:MAG: ABC transporter permease subunit [Gammaproteobacteria bacterium]|nr:MAG: ABC transporter permease subunit [Gammaproteobacteria bacterium]